MPLCGYAAKSHVEHHILISPWPLSLRETLQPLVIPLCLVSMAGLLVRSCPGCGSSFGLLQRQLSGRAHQGLGESSFLGVEALRTYFAFTLRLPREAAEKRRPICTAAESTTAERPQREAGRKETRVDVKKLLHGKKVQGWPCAQLRIIETVFFLRRLCSFTITISQTLVSALW